MTDCITHATFLWICVVSVLLLLIHVAFIYSKKVEDVGVLQEDYIRFLNSLPMDLFESEIWNKFGHEFIAESDRRKVSFSYSSSVLFAAGCNCCMSVYCVCHKLFYFFWISILFSAREISVF